MWSRRRHAPHLKLQLPAVSASIGFYRLGTESTMTKPPHVAGQTGLPARETLEANAGAKPGASASDVPRESDRPPPSTEAPPNIQTGRRRPWRLIGRTLGFLAATGFLSIPVTVLIDWLKEDAPPLVTELSCEVAESSANGQTTAGRAPPLDPTQPITVSIGERLVCGVDQEGGDFVVWRGG